MLFLFVGPPPSNCAALTVRRATKSYAHFARASLWVVLQGFVRKLWKSLGVLMISDFRWRSLGFWVDSHREVLTCLCLALTALWLCSWEHLVGRTDAGLANSCRSRCRASSPG